MAKQRKATLPEAMGMATRAIHGPKMSPVRGPVAPPIVQTSTYRFENSGDAIQYARGNHEVYVYSRYHNPTVREAEERLALMMGTEKALLFSSGMAAVTTSVMSVVHAGDEILSTPSLYGGTYRFFRDSLPLYGIKVRYIDGSGDFANLVSEKTKVIYLETPTNPTLGIVDIRGLVEQKRKAEKRTGRKILVFIDNTFASVLNQNPLKCGVDVIIESGTKYLGGHSDLMAGVVAGSNDFILRVHGLMKHFGGCADPFAAFLLLRSLKTFELRVERQNRNALELAKFLSRHPKVGRVLYPGLPSHPAHAIAKRQMVGTGGKGYGGIVTIEVKGGEKEAVRVCDGLRIALNAMSLGGVETLVSIPIYSSHVNMTSEELARHGVSRGMIRISVGVEDIVDLKADFEQALGRA
jgi:cystathionine beta-lyase/cystathionine gamma-synthase